MKNIDWKSNEVRLGILETLLDITEELHEVDSQVQYSCYNIAAIAHHMSKGKDIKVYVENLIKDPYGLDPHTYNPSDTEVEEYFDEIGWYIERVHNHLVNEHGLSDSANIITDGNSFDVINGICPDYHEYRTKFIKMLIDEYTEKVEN
jgi:hypothetical protein